MVSNMAMAKNKVDAKKAAKKIGKKINYKESMMNK